MAVVTYKCPNCDGGLIFDPETQKFRCEYCMSIFTREELEKLNPAQSTTVSAAPGGPSAKEADDLGHTMVYSCPSCGAEVATDETTAATYCYYCHNPVVLSGRLDGAFRPEKVIPFVIKKEEAVQAFLDWVHKKWFAPRAFFSKQQIDTITGVYFPYWMVDCELDVGMDGQAAKVRTWRSGNTQYTETKHFRIIREGSINFSGITKNALKKANRMLVEGVQPFEAARMKDFMPAYLSGFQAEKRDMERAELREELSRELRGYTQSMLQDSATGYSSVTPGNLKSELVGSDWHYVLLPVWVLTYRGRGDKLYYYAMNGQTGKVCGQLPLDFKRLALLFAGISLPLFLILTIGGYLL